MKKITLFLGIFLLALTVVNPALAKNENRYAPESAEAVDNGVYDVFGHPNMKVKVFVHKANAKPTPAPTNPVCGLSDPGSESTVVAAGWKLPSTVSYKINTSSVPGQFKSGINTIVDNSFGPWVTALGEKSPAVNFIGNTNVDYSRFDGQNIIAWGRASASALGVTYIWWDTNTGRAVEIDTIMNKRFSWSWNGGGTDCASASTYDAQNILIHEIGHWFGLSDHYTGDFANNTMYGYGSKGEVKKNTLTIGDIAGAIAIYP